METKININITIKILNDYTHKACTGHGPYQDKRSKPLNNKKRTLFLAWFFSWLALLVLGCYIFEHLNYTYIKNKIKELAFSIASN